MCAKTKKDTVLIEMAKAPLPTCALMPPSPTPPSSAEVADQHATTFFGSYHRIRQNSFIWHIYALEDAPLSGIVTVWSSKCQGASLYLVNR